MRLWALAVAGALTLSAAAVARADDPSDMSAVGTPLSQGEIDQARLFCQTAIAEGQAHGDPDLTCDCFQLQWEKRTNRLHRLALAITLAPKSPQARSAVWAISHAQDGLHEARLDTLSAELRSAAQAAMTSCAR